VNVYAYVSGDPVGKNDPTGTDENLGFGLRPVTTGRGGGGPAQVYDDPEFAGTKSSQARVSARGGDLLATSGGGPKAPEVLRSEGREREAHFQRTLAELPARRDAKGLAAAKVAGIALAAGIAGGAAAIYIAEIAVVKTAVEAGGLGSVVAHGAIGAGGGLAEGVVQGGLTEGVAQADRGEFDAVRVGEAAAVQGVKSGLFGAAAGLLVGTLRVVSQARLARQVASGPTATAPAAAPNATSPDGAGDVISNRGLGLGVRNTAAVVRSAHQPRFQTTQAGYHWQKHADRNRGGAWGKVGGNSATWHSKGYRHLRDVLRGPGYFGKVKNKDGITFLEKRLPDGRGVRLQQDYTFKGFLDPHE